jgi:hypothetical protein
MSYLLPSIGGLVAIVAIYFLWVRKLTPKAPEQTARRPDAPA